MQGNLEMPQMSSIPSAYETALCSGSVRSIQGSQPQLGRALCCWQSWGLPCPWLPMPELCHGWAGRAQQLQWGVGVWGWAGGSGSSGSWGQTQSVIDPPVHEGWMFLWQQGPPCASVALRRLLVVLQSREGQQWWSGRQQLPFGGGWNAWSFWVWSKVYVITKSVDKLKTELLFASTHHLRAGGKPVKFAEDGFKTSASLHSRQWAAGAGCHGRQREGLYEQALNNLLPDMYKLEAHMAGNV